MSPPVTEIGDSIRGILAHLLGNDLERCSEALNWIMEQATRSYYYDPKTFKRYPDKEHRRNHAIQE